MTAEQFFEIMDCNDSSKILRLMQKYQKMLKSGKFTYEQLQYAIMYDYEVYKSKAEDVHIVNKTNGPSSRRFEAYKVNKYNRTVIDKKEDYDTHVKALKLAYTDMIESEIERSI